MAYISTLPLGYMHIKFWAPAAPRGRARGTLFFYVVKLPLPYCSPQGAYRGPILGGIGTHPRVIPNHGINSMDTPGAQARVVKISNLGPIFDPQYIPDPT